MSSVSIDMPEELVERIAQRAAELVAAAGPVTGRNESDGWLRGAERIAEYIDAPVSRVYALNSAGRIPIEKDGSGLIAWRPDLDAWVRAGGGIRP